MAGTIQNSITIHAGWLIDGSGDPPLEDVSIRIEGGHIERIEAWCGEPRPEEIDLGGCTVLPGLVDSHVHLAMSGSTDPALRSAQLAYSFDKASSAIRKNLAAHASHGIMAVRDGGDRDGHALAFKELNALGLPVVVRSPGWGWHARGRYGSFLGRYPTAGLAGAIGGLRGRADHVKVINSGLNSLTEFGKETSPQFAPEELKAAVVAAGALGLDVMVHANGRAPVAQALEAGCRSIEHGFFMGRDNLGRLADLQVFWVPTACTMKVLAERSTGGDASIARRTLDHQIEQLAQARALGVPVAVGTDSGGFGVDHGVSLIEELSILLSAGFSIAEAIRCASFEGARLLGIDGELGRIERSMPANLIAVPGGPPRLPESLRSPACIVRKGRIVRDVAGSWRTGIF
ncbi:MAG: amidohydrolase family protein [Acidobacteriota bacterium]